MWDETKVEVPCRVLAFARRRALESSVADRLTASCIEAVEANIVVLEEAVYSAIEEEARARSLRDPDDWPVVACAWRLPRGSGRTTMTSSAQASRHGRPGRSDRGWPDIGRIEREPIGRTMAGGGAGSAGLTWVVRSQCARTGDPCYANHPATSRGRMVTVSRPIRAGTCPGASRTCADLRIRGLERPRSSASPQSTAAIRLLVVARGARSGSDTWSTRRG